MLNLGVYYDSWSPGLLQIGNSDDFNTNWVYKVFMIRIFVFMKVSLYGL